jgi:hypothetical protein
LPSDLLPESATRFGPMHMERIHEFCTRLGDASEDTDGQETVVVVCAGGSDAETITDASMLVGSFLILWRGLSVQAVVEAFEPLNDQFVAYPNPSALDGDQHRLSVHDCWSALDHAMRIRWFVPPSVDDEPVLDVDEFAHYARAANGNVHMVVPGKLFFFPSPDDGLPEGQEYADEAAGDGGTRRRFSPAFHAALLADLGVTTVACLRRSTPAAAAAFAARGLGAADLHLERPRTGAGGGALLLALDRLLALARTAPGAIAVHSGAGFEWPAAAGTLAAAFLMSRFGFREAAAAAWLRMLAPWLLRPAPHAPPPPAAPAAPAPAAGSGGAGAGPAATGGGRPPESAAARADHEPAGNRGD